MSTAPLLLSSAVALVALSAGCTLLIAGPGTTAAPGVPSLPQRALDPGIAQAGTGASRRFMACDDCERPTPKQLPGPTRTLLPSAGASAEPGPASRTSLLPAAPAAAAAGLSVIAPTPQPQLAAAAPSAQHFTVHFGHDSARLTPKAQQVIAAVVPHLAAAARVVVTGFTDDVGERGHNDRLAAQRAVAVMLTLQRALALTRDRTGAPATLSTRAEGQGLCCYVRIGGTHGKAPGIDRSASRRVEIHLEPAVSAAHPVAADRVADPVADTTSAQEH